MLCACPRENINHGAARVKVIYAKRLLFRAIINYRLKISELKTLEKLLEQTVQALKFC